MMFNHLENRAENYFMKGFYSSSLFSDLSKLSVQSLYQVAGVADAGEGAGPGVWGHGPLRLHHHPDQPREEAGGLWEPVLEL